MSADMEIWNAGASHASVMRRAIVFRIWFSFTTSTSPLGTRAPADGSGAHGSRCRSALDVLRDDAALRPGPAKGGELDPALAGDPPCERRGLDPAAVLSLLRNLRLRSRLIGLSSALALFLALGTGFPFFFLLLFGDLCGVFGLPFGRIARFGRNIFALLADDRDRLADLDLLPLAGEDLEEDTRSLRLDLLRHLLGVELVERLALLHAVALGLQPAHDGAGLHPLAEARKGDLAAHSLPTVFLIAASTSLAWGTTHSSMTGANGIGVNLAPTRATGASR